MLCAVFLISVEREITILIVQTLQLDLLLTQLLETSQNCFAQFSFGSSQQTHVITHGLTLSQKTSYIPMLFESNGMTIAFSAAWKRFVSHSAALEIPKISVALVTGCGFPCHIAKNPWRPLGGQSTHEPRAIAKFFISNLYILHKLCPLPARCYSRYDQLCSQA